MTSLPRFVLGVDPGKRTGLAVIDVLRETCVGTEEPYEKVGDRLEYLIAGLRPFVAIENFIINATTVKNTQAPWSLKVLGISEYLARKYDCPAKVIMQSSAKRFTTNERLQALGWYVPGRGHLNDAERVALLHMVDTGWWHDSLDDGVPDTITEMT
jgi:hypothetical protein